MLGAAIVVAVVGFVLKAIAAEGAGWFLVPLAAVACLWHIRAHSHAARAPNPPQRLAAVSDILLIGALIMQLDFDPGYNCAWDTLSGVAWRFGWTDEMACTWWAGWPSIVIDLLLYVPVGVTWLRLQGAPAAGVSDGARDLRPGHRADERRGGVRRDQRLPLAPRPAPLLHSLALARRGRVRAPCRGAAYRALH
jgi:hypothetical protein